MAIRGEFAIRACEQHAGLRLDQFVSAHLTGLSRSFVAGLIKKQCVLVDNAVQKPGYRLRGGEEVRGFMPAVTASTDPAAEAIPLSILYSDADLVVVDKAAGMVTHPAPGHPRGTLVNALLHHFPDIAAAGDQARPGIVHRLDRDTSGLVVVAKTPRAMHNISRQFKNREVKKTYQAVVYGIPESDAGRVDLPIGRHPVHRKKMSVVSRSARPAETVWHVAERFSGTALLELDLLTGRTHQIRVHCAAKGMPIVGDPVYGSDRFKRRLTKPMQDAVAPVDRQMLHAWKLSIDHPADGRRLHFEAPLPEDMVALMRRMRAADDKKGRGGEPPRP